MLEMHQRPLPQRYRFHYSMVRARIKSVIVQITTRVTVFRNRELPKSLFENCLGGTISSG